MKCLGIVLFCFSAIVASAGCRGNPPAGPSPAQFDSVTVYFYAEQTLGPPSEGDLDAVDHYQLGPKRTRELFLNARALDGRPFYFGKGGWDYCVVKLKNGGTCIVYLSPIRAFKVENGGYYAFGETGDAEYAAIQHAALVRVKEMARSRRTLTHEDLLDTAGPLPKAKGEKYGYVDVKGKMVIDPKFDDALPFSDGLAPVRVGDADTGKWGYIDSTGAWVIQPQFAGAWFFSEGMAPVTMDDFFKGKMGYIDRKGELVIKPQFEAAGIFLGGHAEVSIDENGWDSHRLDRSGVVTDWSGNPIGRE